MTKPTLSTRAAGILLHPTSLPGPFGAGDLGPEAYRFADSLHCAGMRWWQMLPTSPPGPGPEFSPYSSQSAFAGSPWLLSPQMLFQHGLLSRRNLAKCRRPLGGRIDFPQLHQSRATLLRTAFANSAKLSQKDRRQLDHFNRENAHWLDDYSLYAALKENRPEKSWLRWPVELRRASPPPWPPPNVISPMPSHSNNLSNGSSIANGPPSRTTAIDLASASSATSPSSSPSNPPPSGQGKTSSSSIRAATPRSSPVIRPIHFPGSGNCGDIRTIAGPLTLPSDSPGGFPDSSGSSTNSTPCAVDHFLGFHRVWAVPARSKNAVHGKWIKTPGDALFASLRARLGQIPIIAEDLGKQTHQALALRDKYNFPGMRILQFAFGDCDYHCPHVFPRNSVVYTGTHDNQTIVGWLKGLKTSHNGELARALAYVGGSPSPSNAEALPSAWHFIRILFASVAQTVIVPVQDVLGLGAEHRMNVPGILHGNWGWRMSAPMPQDAVRNFAPRRSHRTVQTRGNPIPCLTPQNRSRNDSTTWPAISGGPGTIPPSRS